MTGDESGPGPGVVGPCDAATRSVKEARSAPTPGDGATGRRSRQTIMANAHRTSSWQRMATDRVAGTVFHLVCARNDTSPNDYAEEYFQRGFASTKLYFERLGGKLDFVGKTVMDLGCGFGTTCIYMALNGASRVVGVDVDETRIAFARAKLARDYPRLAGIVEFKFVSELHDETFDIILSKDSFEHIANPETSITHMRQHLATGGLVAIGFGPLWKSPYGGHIDYMTRLPWAHLLVPESVIMRERRRFRPDEHAETFDEMVGGLNKMTLRRFTNIMSASGLESVYLETNSSDSWVTPIFNVLRHVRWFREYCTFNVYSIWRMPA
jgi:2-polyprenyl-3-methyl-5-hydroxy-6-metoxy-1,4-benzoquinol methylase